MLASAALAGRATNSATLFSMLAISFSVASSAPAVAVAIFCVVVPEVIMGLSDAILGAPELIIVEAPSGFPRFNSFSCSFSRVTSWLLSGRSYSTTWAVTPGPVTKARLMSSRPCPPSLIWKVVPCWPPAG
jgi:hypothetical protein